MDESATKVMKPLELNDSDAAVGETRIIREISVEGFETCSLQYYALTLALTKHFSSCGKVSALSVGKSVAYMKIEGANAEEKALALSGTDVGGWYAIVKAEPWVRQSIAYGSCAPRFKPSRFFVSGYDTCLDEIDIKIALCKHFSSCGDIRNIKFLHRYATITIEGERCVEKALELSGRDVGGMKLVVDPVVLRRESVKRKWPSRKVIRSLSPGPFRDQLEEEYKMLKEEEEKENNKLKEKEMMKEKEMNKEMEMNKVVKKMVEINKEIKKMVEKEEMKEQMKKKMTLY